MSLFSDLTHNLRSGLALALFRRRGLHDFRVNIDQVVALIVLSLLIEVGTDFLLSLPAPRFVSGAFSAFALSQLLFVFVAYLFSRLVGRQEAAVQLLVIAYSAAMVAYLALLAAELPARYSDAELPLPAWYILLFLPGAWLLVILSRALFVIAERNLKMTVAGAVILLGVWGVPMSLGNWQDVFWYSQPADEGDQDPYAAYREMDGETLMYAQPERVQEALATVAPGRPGVSDLYFIGVAGYAFQDVFAKEVRYARRLMDERYGTQERSLLFMNHLDSRSELPLASVSNLELALRQLAARIQPEEDVVMLYLTSHGSEAHELAFDFWPLPLNDLTPERLRRMLDEAGIQWRIVVVSACYSGGFVASLEDQRTLVATAAAPDRKSFGCSNENDFTYFGEALFKESLSHEDSLLQAFRKTPPRIAEREQAEKLEPSQPQLFVGEQMERKLEAMAYRQCGAQGDSDAAGC